MKERIKSTKIKFNYLFTAVIITSSIFSQLPDKHQSISFFTGTGVPILGLNNWYNVTPVIGIQYAFKNNESTETVFEFHYQKYNHGSIENKKFKWIVDYNYYSSNQANANMIWNDFILKTRKYFTGKTFDLVSRRIHPSITYGIGFYNYTHHVKGLIYPGQYRQPLDENKIMAPVTDRRVAWGGNLGVGGYSSINQTMNLLFSINYHTSIGYLRSFEDWGLFEVVPLQFLTFELGLTYKY
ncbi:MAG: hypothetical protein ACE5D0_02005 [Fidelibacterota bacterium]